MANRFMTRDEVTLELGIPFMRTAIVAAQAALKPKETMVIVPNVVRDCLPISFERGALENGGAEQMLAKLDTLEQELRERIAKRSAKT